MATRVATTENWGRKFGAPFQLGALWPELGLKNPAVLSAFTMKRVGQHRRIDIIFIHRDRLDEDRWNVF